MDFKSSVGTLEELGEPSIPVSAIGIYRRDPVNGSRTTLALSPDGSHGHGQGVHCFSIVGIDKKPALYSSAVQSCKFCQLLVTV